MDHILLLMNFWQNDTLGMFSQVPENKWQVKACGAGRETVYLKA